MYKVNIKHLEEIRKHLKLVGKNVLGDTSGPPKIHHSLKRMKAKNTKLIKLLNEEYLEIKS
ncbi:MAG TPA: hypothetical protein VMZ91_00040 [Candidatus Paceibacterota bacterium]|nr:hypothetical protein [Candidatus Paceibacterota bacterium]